MNTCMIASSGFEESFPCKRSRFNSWQNTNDYEQCLWSIPSLNDKKLLNDVSIKLLQSITNLRLILSNNDVVG